VLDFAAKYKVTHFLLQRTRLGDDFRSRSRSFEPLSTFTHDLLANRDASEFVLGDPPKSAEVAHYRGYVLLSVEKLKQAWHANAP